MFKSEFGYFTDDGREYVITRVDTPRPWLNYMANDVYGACQSQNGFGYSLYRAALDVRVTYIHVFGYVPTHPQTGRFVYLHDADSKRNWSLAPLSPLDPHRRFSCRQGLGYSVIHAEHEGLAAEFTVFVPRQDPVELWQIRLRNLTRRPRRLRFFPYVEAAMACTGEHGRAHLYPRPVRAPARRRRDPDDQQHQPHDVRRLHVRRLSGQGIRLPPREFPRLGPDDL